MNLAGNRQEQPGQPSSWLTLVHAGACLFLFAWLIVDLAPSHAQSTNYLHTDGSKLVDGNGNQVILTGINWFGLETENFAPHGLWARNWESLLDQIKELGFNTIRLPYSNALFAPESLPNGIDFNLNPDLQGLSGLEVMDKIIAGAGARGLRVILDRHRPDSHAQSELWYTAAVSEERWIADWVMLAERYAGDDTVIGMDLHNEPHGAATWGSDDPATDWRLAAERAGNAILAANPDLLIIVQGVEQYQGDWYWWGGNLMGARSSPVRLDVPDRLVYSTHVYGPGVYPQPWFSDATFPDNLPAIWDRHWGYLSQEAIAPVIVGEFGGRSVGEDAEGIWQRALVSYLREQELSYFYWTLNPNSGDTGGVLLDDWQSVDSQKQELLSTYQFPAIGADLHTPIPDETLPTPPSVSPDQLQVAYRTAAPDAITQNSMPEFIIANHGADPISLAHVELRYWLDEGQEAPLVFRCDWAAVGCQNIQGDFQRADNGARFLALHFTPGSGVLAEGADTGEIKVRFHRSDWSPFHQDIHYSFDTHAEYATWEQVTLYVDGQQVWGVEPVATDTTATPVAPTAAPSVPAATPIMPQATPTASPGAAVAAAQPTPPPTIAAQEKNPQPATGRLATGQLVAVAALALAVLGLGIIVGLWFGRRQRNAETRP